MGIRMYRLALLPLLVLSQSVAADYTFDRSQQFLKTYCKTCHQGAKPLGGFGVDHVAKPDSFKTAPGQWTRASLRVVNHEMPPANAPSKPAIDEVEAFTRWVETSLRESACEAGTKVSPVPVRRLNRDEYAATIRDLFDIHLDLAALLPVDGAGGEGFDNAAETLFLSPLHSEKYLETAKFALDFAAKEFKSRNKIFVATPGPGVTEEQAARAIFADVLPRAFRRPVTEADITPYVALYHAVRKQGQTFEQGVLFAIRAVLVSPKFLFRAETGDYAFASRLSYFLWGSIPDDLLTDVAASGKIRDRAVIKELIPRMLRNDRSLGFAQRFIDQWLHTRELTGDKAPDPKLYPALAADEELRSDIRLQPSLFFRELLIRDLSLLNLIESKHTIGTSNLSKFFGVKLPVNPGRSKQPQWVELPEGSRRGGLLGMPAVLAVSSYPYRTSPVLRGAWVLEAILGTPPPPPPPDVPALEEAKEGQAPKTVRERLAKHRENAVCAGCHARIDPLGFALENYDAVGRWRDQEAGRDVDNSGQLADGTAFQGPDELKTALIEKKDLFLRNVTRRMLGFALGRGLTLGDACAVEQIVAEVKQNDYRAQALLEAIVMSAPFQANQESTQ